MTTPEFKECVNCGKHIEYVMGSCRNCGAERPAD
jgi:predicted amidophosphoribosyltransferase